MEMKKKIGIVLLLAISLFILTPAQVDAGPCEKGLMRCMLGAGIWNIYAGAMCVEGYSWCVAFYAPVN